MGLGREKCQIKNTTAATVIMRNVILDFFFSIQAPDFWRSWVNKQNSLYNNDENSQQG
jgi:hypothetical protein